MSKTVSSFARRQEAASALGEIELENFGTGQVIPLDGRDATEVIAANLFLDHREASLIAAGAVLGFVLGALLMYSHRVGLLVFPLLSPAFAGGSYPAYFAGGGVGAAVGAFLCNLYALSAPRDLLGPDPTLLTVFAPRYELKKVRATVQGHGGRVI
jgi:hypothetical protein